MHPYVCLYIPGGMHLYITCTNLKVSSMPTSSCIFAILTAPRETTFYIIWKTGKSDCMETAIQILKSPNIELVKYHPISDLLTCNLVFHLINRVERNIHLSNLWRTDNQCASCQTGYRVWPITRSHDPKIFFDLFWPKTPRKVELHF